VTLATAEARELRRSTPLAPPPLLDVRNVSKAFGTLQVLEGVSLRVDAGQVVALVGDNGAGKSTLARCIARTLRPDTGDVVVRGRALGPHHDDALAAGVGVVWQDLALCDNLDTVANLFLGRERRRVLLSGADMHRDARAAIERLGIPLPDLRRPVAALSGGQRQAIAVARALDADPALLILDEPTASLGRRETAQVLGLVRELRASGTAVLLISHQLDQVIDLADRIVVLRHGQVVANVTPLEVHPDDIVALQSGIEIDSTASRQLRRLGSLVEQLSEAEPTASLPLVVTAMAAAIGQESLCVHLLDAAGPTPVLRRSAAVALAPELLDAIDELPVGDAGGPIGQAAAGGAVVVTEDVRRDPAWAPLAGAATRAGILSSWTAPVVGATGVLGTITGVGETVGRPRADQLELITLYAGHAAASIERERLFAESRRRNRVLEAIRSVLEVLAGPEQVRTGLDPALTALCEALSADGAALRVVDGSHAVTRAAVDGAGGPRPHAVLEPLTDRALGRDGPRRSEVDGGAVLAVPFVAPGGAAALGVWWADARQAEGAGEVLGDVARSLRLALERAELERTQQEAEALRRTQRLQRAFLSRLSHELRTPLTAIHGCVDTLRQPDVEWAEHEQARFLGTIATESDRMRRLVADLLDASAIDAGLFRVHPDWCDLGLVLDASVACVGDDGERVRLAVPAALGPVWADHDRLEQVFVNLLDNALRHTPAGTPVRVEVALAPGGGVEVRVEDDGPGVPAEVAAELFEPHRTGDATGGHGLGLAIARGIAVAHGGALLLDAAEGAGAAFVVRLPAGPQTTGATAHA
jgi:signal transduction histidine kinase/ABC-type multidrug transport system ATPase subunit